MSPSPQWEYLTVLVATELLDYEVLHPKSVNGQELDHWKKVDLNTFLSRLGADHWEMTGVNPFCRTPRKVNFWVMVYRLLQTQQEANSRGWNEVSSHYTPFQ
jgi:hypothetical protein